MIQRAYGLTTDLYELAMAAAYFENGVEQRAVFELFIRRLPEHRSYLIAAGLEQALDYLAALSFTAEQIEYLQTHKSFQNVSAEFFDYLARFRFTGDVWAIPEGTAVFGMEPLLRVTAPIIEAQIVETFLLSTINFQTMVSSKAARIVTAAQGRSVIEFGTRRAHGTEAGLFAARAAYIGGCVGTSNVEAGFLFGIPTFGTLAHSFIMSFDREDDAFQAFLKVFPTSATVLVDTYDTIAAVKRLARDFGSAIPAVRLDSGDLLGLSKQARKILDDAGMTETRIFASGDLNEYKIAELISRGAQIDSFGVGTELATSYDAPALSGVYKLAAIEQSGGISLRMKLSHDKATYPGAKQVWRFTDGSGKYARDLVAQADEQPPLIEPEGSAGSWRPLLAPVMTQGRLDEALASDRAPGASTRSESQARFTRLDQARAEAAKEIKRLPDNLLALDSAARYATVFSQRLTAEMRKLEKQIARPPN
jgi:nicotinate phosphoribosyltransferase